MTPPADRHGTPAAPPEDSAIARELAAAAAQAKRAGLQSRQTRYVLCYSPDDYQEITVHPTAEAAAAHLARIARDNWDWIAGSDGAPDTPDTPDELTDHQAVDTYFARTPDETYAIAPAAVIPARHRPARPGRAVIIEAPGGDTLAYGLAGDDTLTVLVDGHPVLGIDKDGPGHWHGDQWHRLPVPEPGNQPELGN